MTSEARLLWFLLALAAITIATGCRHKPAYSDIDANKASARNQNSESKNAAASVSPTADLPGGDASQPAGSSSPQRFKNPTFMDQAGAIKDLPNYPRAIRTSIQVGPSQGLNVMTVTFLSGDSMDQINAFYQKTIRDNQWTVVDKLIDPDSSDWILKKGEDQTARIQIARDTATRSLRIGIVRGEKMEETGK